MNSDKQKVFIQSGQKQCKIDKILADIDTESEFHIVFNPEEADVIVIDISNFSDQFKNKIFNELNHIPPKWFRRIDNPVPIPVMLVNLFDLEVPQEQKNVEVEFENIFRFKPPVVATKENILSQLKWLSYFSKEAIRLSYFSEKAPTSESSSNDQMAMVIQHVKSLLTQTKEE